MEVYNISCFLTYVRYYNDSWYILNILLTFITHLSTPLHFFFLLSTRFFSLSFLRVLVVLSKPVLSCVRGNWSGTLSSVNRLRSWSVPMLWRLEFSWLMMVFAMLILNFCSPIIFSSSVPRVMSRYTFTTRFYSKQMPSKKTGHQRIVTQ